MTDRMLLHVFSTFAVGGPQRRTVDVANALGAGYRHVIVPLDGRAEAASGFAPEVRFAIEPLPVVKGRGLAIGNLRRFRELLRRLRPGLLLTYNFGALEAALANRLRPLCPHLHFEDGFGPEEAGGRQLPRRVWLRRLALSGSSRIVVPSRTLETIATRVWRFRPARVLHIPNGIDCARYAAGPEPTPPGLRREPGELLVGTLGMLRAEKNLGRLLRTFAAATAGRPARLVVIGDGPERPRLEPMAAELGIAERVTFTGFTARPEAALRELDLFALSSDTEQMPLSLVEAMAAGLPAVATAVGDVPELVPEAQRAYVVPREDEAAFAERLAALLGDPARRARLGTLNREHARRTYGIERMVERYAALFDELTAPSAAARGMAPAPSAS
jgi:L-malate glycosyltransferase